MKHWLVSLVVSGLLVAPAIVRGDAGVGAGIGALGGAMVGSHAGPGKNRMENTLIGGVVGGLLGYALGNEAEKQGRVMVNQTLETVPSYTTTTWTHPETHVTYQVTPQPAIQYQGQICREVNIQGTIDGKQETLSGLSCRDDSGQWRLTDRHSVTTAPTSTLVVSRPVTQYVVVEPYRRPYYYYPSYLAPAYLAASLHLHGGHDHRHGYRGGHRYGWRHRH